MPLIFLNGTGMAGEADHWIVGDSPLVAQTSTAPRYRFLAVGGAYPGLEDVGLADGSGPGGGGASIVGEVYDVSYEQLREVLLPAEPAGLELGVIELADGTGSLAMVVRRDYAEPADRHDISAIGSWRAYRAGPSGAADAGRDRDEESQE